MFRSSKRLVAEVTLVRFFGTVSSAVLSEVSEPRELFAADQIRTVSHPDVFAYVW